MSEAESDGVKSTTVREARRKLPPSIDVNPWLTSASPSLFLKLEISGRLSKHRLKIGFRSASKHSTYCRVLTEIWRYKHDFVFLCNSPTPHAIYSESYFQTFYFAKVQLQRRHLVLQEPFFALQCRHCFKGPKRLFGFSPFARTEQPNQPAFPNLFI